MSKGSGRGGLGGVGGRASAGGVGDKEGVGGEEDSREGVSFESLLFSPSR